MAKVFLGSDTVLGRTVAVKVLAPQFADDDGFVMRFRREAQAAASIGHPNIVSVFDTGSDDGVHFIVMEYVEGRTLAEILAGGGRILPERAIDIAIDVCGALEAAHAQGVIHRDIKPGNIMLNPRGEVKVTDFGIARVTTTADTVAQTAAILGTASYLSPEQAQGQPVDGRSDIYSLGCVLYEMVTGRPPFLGDSPVAVASKQVLEQPTPPSRLNSDVTADLDAVILRALAKNPANRYQSAEEMRSDLERAKRGLPVQATPLLAAGATQVLDRPPAHPTEVLAPTEPDRRTNWVPIVVTLVLIALLGALLWFLAVNVLNNDDQQTGVLVTVPDVVGDRRAQAIGELEDAGLEVGVGADRVEVAQDDRPQPGRARHVLQHHLHHPLGAGVRRPRLEGVGLHHLELRLERVERRRGGEQHARLAQLLQLVEQLEGLGDVVAVVLVGLGHRLGHDDPRRHVDGRVEVGVLLDHPAHQRTVGDVALVEDPVLHEHPGPGQQRVEDHRGVAGLLEGLGGDRADVAGAARHENLHARQPRR